MMATCPYCGSDKLTERPCGNCGRSATRGDEQLLDVIERLQAERAELRAEVNRLRQLVAVLTPPPE